MPATGYRPSASPLFVLSYEYTTAMDRALYFLVMTCYELCVFVNPLQISSPIMDTLSLTYTR